MKFFIDTAKVEDIKAANDMGIICGVTTNPSLIAKEGRARDCQNPSEHGCKNSYDMRRSESS